MRTISNRIKGITIEIGGDTTKLQDSLKGVNSEIKSTQLQLKDVEKLLKLDPNNTELLAQKQKLLKAAIEETNKKLEALQTAAEQANTALAKGEISQEQYDALQREIVETEQVLKSLETQANSSKSAIQKIAEAGNTIKTAGETISSIGEQLTQTTSSIVDIGSEALTTAANFEASMSQVQATMGLTKDSLSTVNGQTVNTMDTLSDLAKKMGAETAFSASECAEALNYLALAGYNTQEMSDTLPTVLSLAAAGGIDLASASDMVTDAMSALGMETSDANVMVDQMAKTASTTNTSVAQLGEGILKIGATAKSIRGGTAELNTALGILANNGVKGAEGGTHLRNIILSLQSPVDKAANLMEDLSLSVYDSEGNMRSLNDILGDLNASMEGMTSEEKTNIISTIFNKTDLSAVNALLANTGDAWNGLQQSITDSGGAAEEMADTQLDNLNGQITILKSALEALYISMGELLLPSIKQGVEWIQKSVDWLNSLDEETQKLIITIAIIVAAIGPVLIIIGKVISAGGSILTLLPQIINVLGLVKIVLSGLWGVMIANPISLVIAAITALIAIFMHLWNTSEEFRNFWIIMWELLKITAGEAKKEICKFFEETSKSVSNTASEIANSVETGFGNAIAFITGIPARAVGWGEDMINGIATGIRNAIGAVEAAVSSVAGKITSYLHFSVPDEGPLTEYESWMPDFLDGLAKGILQNQSEVEKAVEGVAEMMNLSNAIPEMSANMNATISGSSSNGKINSGNETTVKLNQPIMLDGKIISTLVSQIQYSNGQALLRNLGTV